MSSETRGSLGRGRLALLAAGVLWSLGGVFIKRVEAGPLAITFYRSLFAAIDLLALAALRQLPPSVRTPSFVSSCLRVFVVQSIPGFRPRTAAWPVRDMAVSMLLFAALLVTFVTATRLTTAANAIFLQYTAPIYVIGLSALLLREPPQRGDQAALLLCMAGVGVLFFGNYHPGGSDLGLVLALVSGACFGLFILWQRHLRQVDPVLLAGLNNAGAALVLAAALPWIGPVDERALLVLVVMGTVQIALPYVLFAWALQRVAGPEASLLTLIEPVLNPIWVALFVGEKPSLATLLGGALILGALILRYTLWRK